MSKTMISELSATEMEQVSGALSFSLDTDINLNTGFQIDNVIFGASLGCAPDSSPSVIQVYTAT